jgi:hypothetical protein
MSNNKQSMKLYTEEHLKIFYHLGKIDGFIGRQDDVNELIKNYPPIELPSDEEIEQYLKSFPYTKHLDDGQYNDGVIVGAELAIEWMRDKIQGGNNEQ